MIYQNSTKSIDEQKSVKIDNDDSVCITRSYESSMAPVITYLFFNKIPLWVDLLPGRYNLTCQMRLRQFVRKLISLIFKKFSISIRTGEKRKSY